MKVAVTASAAFIVTVHVGACPEHAPLQLAKPPTVTFAVSVTTVLWGNDALQVPGQLIPDGMLVTVPVPPPDIVTLNFSEGGGVGGGWFGEFPPDEELLPQFINKNVKSRTPEVAANSLVLCVIDGL